jgi:hypothetical protein
MYTINYIESYVCIYIYLYVYEIITPHSVIFIVMVLIITDSLYRNLYGKLFKNIGTGFRPPGFNPRFAAYCLYVLSKFFNLSKSQLSYP